MPPRPGQFAGNLCCAAKFGASLSRFRRCSIEPNRGISVSYTGQGTAINCKSARGQQHVIEEIRSRTVTAHHEDRTALAIAWILDYQTKVYLHHAGPVSYRRMKVAGNESHRLPSATSMRFLWQVGKRREGRRKGRSAASRGPRLGKFRKRNSYSTFASAALSPTMSAPRSLPSVPLLL